jgi:SAM-dependent methyltransferase
MVQAELESPYDFRDPDLATAWEAQIRLESTWRERFFAAITAALNAEFAAPFSVLELGSGPGHLARSILAGVQASNYLALDYSPAMHALAAAHLGALAGRVRFVVRDFRQADWTAGLGPFDAAVTMMAAHEVRRSDRLAPLLAQLSGALKPSGRLLFADFHATAPSHEGLYVSLADQRETIEGAGFERVELILDDGGMALFAASRRMAP